MPTFSKKEWKRMKAARAAQPTAAASPESKKDRFMVVIGSLVGIVAFLASVAGILQLSGYSIREFIEKPGHLEVTVGSMLLRPNEKVEVTCYFEAPLDDNPVLCHIPLAFQNPWGKAAKNVRIGFGCSSNQIHLCQPNETLMVGRGFTSGMERVPSRMGRHSTSAWSIDSFGPGTGALLTEAVVVEAPNAMVDEVADEELVIAMSIEADDFPRAVYMLNFRPAWIHETDPATKLTRISRGAHGKGIRRAEIILPNMKLGPFVDGTPSWSVSDQEAIMYKAFDEQGNRVAFRSPLFTEAPPREMPVVTSAGGR
jgi:hypothetical protein